LNCLNHAYLLELSRIKLNLGCISGMKLTVHKTKVYPVAVESFGALNVGINTSLARHLGKRRSSIQ